MMHNPCARRALLATCVLVLLGCADRDQWPSLLDVPPLPDTAPVVPDSLLNAPPLSEVDDEQEDTSAPDTSAPDTSAPTSKDQSEP